jgi:putative ABC transport system ATP-binding protein
MTRPSSHPDNQLAVSDLRLSYPSEDGGCREVLRIDRFSAEARSVVAVTGPSGSGKTSLLYALSGLERPQAGAIVWGETDIFRLDELQRDRWRHRNVGFVFQDFHLFPGLSVLENVLLPATFQSIRPSSELRVRAVALLGRFELTRHSQRVETLSRGEMQRVAIARALLFSPPVILADEPTASLDEKTGRAVSELLLMTVKETGCTLVVVTHDPDLLKRIETVYRIINGRIHPGREGVGHD